MLQNILQFKDKFDIYLFDIYGVIWDGKRVIDGALETMKALKKAGKKVMLLSNGTVLSPKVELSYAKRGFIKGEHYDVVVTSGDAYHDYLINEKKSFKVYQFGRPSSLFADSQFEEVKNPQEADFVYAGVPQILEGEVWKDFLTLAPFEEELKYLVGLGKKLVCVNPDLKAFENQYDEPVVRQGSVAKFYEENGGKVEYWGKPHANIYDYALNGIEVPRERMLMIGDTLRTDILGGRNAGMKTALTLTGISLQEMREAGGTDILEYAKTKGIVPDYII